MFVQNQIVVCLLAVLGAQVFYASASPVETISDDGLEENTAENEQDQLERRGLFDFASNPMNMMSGGAKAVNDNLMTARAAGTNAVQNAVGNGMQVTTGVNPVAFVNLPHEIMKKAVQGAKIGTTTAFDVTDKTLDGVQTVHEKRKQLVNDYVKPMAPTMVSNAMDTVDNRLGSAINNMKERSKNGRAAAMETLRDLEARIESGSPILPAAITERLENAGSWLQGLGFGPGMNPSKAAEDVAAEAQAPLKAAENAGGKAAEQAAAEAAATPLRAARRFRDVRPTRRSSWLS